MMMYLLLRNNKQSGPYSLDELKTLGLKAYDLVWVDGKSAAWRYPSELEELSSFAPAVEEQPFDRFYKRASPAKDTLPVAPAPVYAGEPSTVPGKRIIYVTMPAGKSIGPVREPAPVRETAKTPPSVLVNRPLEPRPALQVDNTGYAAYQPVPSGKPSQEPEENLSHVPEDRKNVVEIIPPIRKRAASRLWQPVAVVVCILALLAAGIFIGLSINKDRFGLGKKIASRDALTNGQRVGRVPQQLPVAAPANPAPSTLSQAPLTDSLHTPASASATEKGLTKAQTGKVQPPRQFPPKERSAGGNSKNQSALPSVARDSASMGIPIVHREAVHRTDLAVDKNDNMDKEVVKNNIANLVSVGTKGYTVGTFGGINDLQLTVSNHSVYPLDLVVVEVQYIQANKKVFKTENLYFRGIAPGAALMQEAPKSTRGIKVQYKITLVNSKELGLSYSGI